MTGVGRKAVTLSLGAARVYVLLAFAPPNPHCQRERIQPLLANWLSALIGQGALSNLVIVGPFWGAKMCNDNILKINV